MRALSTWISAIIAACCCDVTLGFPATNPNHNPSFGIPRREAVLGSAAAWLPLLPPRRALARAPGSTDIAEAIQQIQDASLALRGLEQDWALYSKIDDEGRAGSTDGARRILGGITPQAGSAAIEAAKKTPLYRIDNAFVAVRKAALEGEDAWADALDLDQFEELAERILYEIQKADGNFYSVLFAAKGTKMIADIYQETKGLVRQGIKDFDQMIVVLNDAGAPGL